jgi:hypothetical protein
MVKKQGAKRRPWNKGLEVGKKGALPAQVKRIRQVLMAHGASGLRDLALFQVARHRRFGDGSDAPRSREDRINGEVPARAHNVP